MEKMYKLREACEILRVSKKTIYRWEKAGKIKCVRTPGNHRLIPESEISRILSIKPEKLEKERKIEDKKEKKDVIKPKTFQKVTVSREEILNALQPTSMVQRSAFSDLISTIVTLRQFTTVDLMSRARCPESIVKLFCDQMEKLGYLRKIDENKYELTVEVKT